MHHACRESDAIDRSDDMLPLLLSSRTTDQDNGMSVFGGFEKLLGLLAGDEVGAAGTKSTGKVTFAIQRLLQPP